MVGWERPEEPTHELVSWDAPGGTQTPRKWPKEQAGDGAVVDQEAPFQGPEGWATSLGQWPKVQVQETWESLKGVMGPIACLSRDALATYSLPAAGIHTNLTPIWGLADDCPGGWILSSP